MSTLQGGVIAVINGPLHLAAVAAALCYGLWDQPPLMDRFEVNERLEVVWALPMLSSDFNSGKWSSIAPGRSAALAPRTTPPRSLRRPGLDYAPPRW